MTEFEWNTVKEQGSPEMNSAQIQEDTAAAVAARV